MLQNQSEYLDAIDRLIRDGKGELAIDLVRKHYHVKFNSEGRARFGSLARRLGQFEFALRLLNPYVRPASRIKTEATPRERAEYAASLSNLGAVAESLELLRSLDANQLPEVLLYEAHALFSQWEYATAIPLLIRYVAVKDLTEHQKLVGNANLAAALVYERDSRAKTVLDQLIDQAKRGEFTHTIAYAERLSGEKAFYDKNWEEATHKFHTAEKLFGHSAALELLFAKKWLAITELYQSRNRRMLDEVRKSAGSKRHWETLRNCDYHESVALKNDELMFKVYFGTPYASLRQRLIADCGYGGTLPEVYQWKMSAHRTATHAPVDIFGNSKFALKPGQSLHRLGIALCSDFYRPVRSASVFAQVYPGEYFNPVSSDNRVKQIIHRLRGWISKLRLPLEITSDDGGYRLQPQAKGALCIHRDQTIAESQHFQMEMFTRVFARVETFTVQDVMKSLSVPMWTAKRLLKTAFDTGIVLRTGKARATTYTIHSTQPKSRTA